MYDSLLLYLNGINDNEKDINNSLIIEITIVSMLNLQKCPGIVFSIVSMNLSFRIQLRKFINNLVCMYKNPLEQINGDQEGFKL